MKKRLSISALVAVCLLLGAWNALSQEDQYDAVYRSLVKEYTLNPDGSVTYHFIKDMKLLTYRSFQNLYGETFVVYNPVYQSLKINDCYTIMADGKKVITPKNAFNEVLPGVAAGAPAFNDLREMVITHTGLERNATIHLDYELTSKPGFYPALAGEELLSEVEPVNSLTIKIIVPSARELSYRVFPKQIVPSKTKSGNSVIYTWQLKNPAIIPGDDFQPGGNAAIARLVFSTAGGPGQWIGNLANQKAFSYVISDEMKKVVTDVTSAVKDSLAVALRLQEIIVNEMNLVNIPMRYTGYRIRTPEQTWNGNYGNSAEKALLFSAMLRSAGIHATPVLCFRSRLFDPSATSLASSDDYLVKADIPGKEPVFLSVTSLNPQDLFLSLPDRTMVVLEAGKNPEILETPADVSTCQLTGSLFLSADNKLTGEISTEQSNGFDPWLALTRDAAKAKQYPGGGLRPADLKEVTMSQPGRKKSAFTFNVQKDNALKIDSSFRYFTIPFAAAGIESWGIKLLPSTRTAPLELPFAATEKTEIRLTLPEGLTLFSPETHTEISNGAGRYVYDIREESGKILITKSITVTGRIIEPSRYKEFKVLMDNWNSPPAKQVIFRKR